MVYSDRDTADVIVTRKDVLGDVLIQDIFRDILLAVVEVANLHGQLAGCALKNDRNLAECVGDGAGRQFDNVFLPDHVCEESAGTSGKGLVVEFFFKNFQN